MIRLYTILCFVLPAISLYGQEVPSPEDFLGYEPGKEFTLHHKVVNYFEAVAAASPSVKLYQYGNTYEGRPLYVAYISAPENLENLENIRLSNLRRTGLKEGAPEADQPAIVWLSYNVHGNESSSTEASLKTLYYLSNPENAESREWLQNTLVIMDPCINPDGRDRYVNYYKRYAQVPPAVDPYAMSHQEDWPGGRTNHYLFDLNRDWLWLSQQESQQRLALYNSWMPQIHVDFHEQSPDSPYYFAPGAEPYHDIITDWQREFQKTIGENHASYFDKNNWVYFTAEVFDLLYPSYGDTYPTFNGAIGMTYEQAGGGSAGLSVKTEYGDTLFLTDRIAHHFTTGISTVEVSARNREKLLDEFDAYFNSPAGGKYQSFVLSGSNQPDKIKRLLKLLDQHNITYGTASNGRRFAAYDYQLNREISYTPAANDIIIPVNQPKGRLVRAIFEPVTTIADTVTYDITAWSLPYAFGLDAWASTSTLIPDGKFTAENAAFTPPEEPPYGYLIPYESLEDGIFLGALLQSEIEVGVLNKPSRFGTETLPVGSIVALRANNNFHPAFDRTMARLAVKYNRTPLPVYTGMSTSGIDLGSGNISRISPERVALLAGSGTSSNRVGEVWHFFERQFNYPLTLIRKEDASDRILEDFDVVILVDGNYGKQKETLFNFVSEGGRIIAIGSALDLFASADEFNLRPVEQEAAADSLGLSNYGMEERENVSDYISGAIFRVSMDTSHPLSYGYRGEYETLTMGTDAYILPHGHQVALFDQYPEPLNGFAGHNTLRQISGKMLLGVERHGRGKVIYFADNPLFRSFWEQGKLLIINAVLQVN